MKNYYDPHGFAVTYQLIAVLLALTTPFTVSASAMTNTLKEQPLVIAFAEEDEDDEEDVGTTDEAIPSATELREWAMRRRESRGDELPVGYDSVIPPRTFHIHDRHAHHGHHRKLHHERPRHGGRHGHSRAFPHDTSRNRHDASPHRKTESHGGHGSHPRRDSPRQVRNKRR